MHSSLYGPGGFYTRHVPAAHFRTSAQLPHFAQAIAELIRRVDTALEHPDTFTVVDVGAGSGELLNSIVSVEPLGGRLAAVAVELRERPTGLTGPIQWRAEPPQDFTGVLLACEWLDNIACDVVEQTTDGPRYRLVSPDTGDTAVGEAVSPEDRDWLARWWPLTRPGDQADIGAPRDAAWRDLSSRLNAGLAVAIDYGHLANDRPQWSTMVGYARGRDVAAVPDGNRDITAHVAMDSLGDGMLLRQRDALKALGLTPARPSWESSHCDPVGYLQRLSAAGDIAELTDPAGLGRHWWLTQGIGIGHDTWLTGQQTRPAPGPVS